MFAFGSFNLVSDEWRRVGREQSLPDCFIAKRTQVAHMFGYSVGLEVSYLQETFEPEYQWIVHIRHIQLRGKFAQQRERSAQVVFSTVFRLECSTYVLPKTKKSFFSSIGASSFNIDNDTSFPSFHPFSSMYCSRKRNSSNMRFRYSSCG